jgi:hypothetical protein
MGAKPVPAVFVVAALAAAGGCAELNLARFAPPGIIKYEDIAGDQPVNEQIEARIEERKAAGESKTPNLSEQPQKIPTGASKAERESLAAELRAKRASLTAAVEADRQASLDERAAEVHISGEGSIKFEATAETLSRAVERDTAAAREERGLPPAPAENDPGEEE